MKIAFTGPRQLTQPQTELVETELQKLIKTPSDWFVGDAKGLDLLVRSFAYSHHKEIEVFEVQGTERYHFSERSKRMIDAISSHSNSVLYAFPNKPCPVGCKPSKNPNGNGSGTWLTVSYAKYKNVEIKIIPLTEMKLPVWLEEPSSIQLSFF